MVFPTGFWIYQFLPVSDSPVRCVLRLDAACSLLNVFLHVHIDRPKPVAPMSSPRVSCVSCLSAALSSLLRPASAEGRVVACRRRRGSSVACPVCLDVFQPQDAVTLLTCGHAFHWKCVEPWLERSSRCPCCR